jgi:splicing factor 45
MSNSSTPARGTGLSLYANLLDPSAATTPGTISKAPVVFKTGAADTPEEASAKRHQIDAGRPLIYTHDACWYA